MDAIASDHGGIPHAGLAIQHTFHILGKDVQAFGRDDHFLLAAEDGEFAVFVEASDIAGIEPAVGKS